MSEARKLAAILVADIVGFSRLTSNDEDRTIARVRALRSDLVDPTITVHRGRVVKGTGDGVLSEFRSVVDAVGCAIELQTGMVERNSGLPPERRIELRIGIHIGDVVEEADGDLMGEGVNIAARLEGIAQPGTICLSEDAYRQVRSRLDLSVSDLGEKVLKNIAEPMRVYALEVGQQSNLPRHTSPGAPNGASAGKQVRSEKPSIAVLPFMSFGGDAEQQFLGDGIAEDVITELSRFRELVVVARNSSFQFRQASDIRKVGIELGCAYVVEGSVRSAGSRVRITAQLIEVETGHHVWADKFDRDKADIFAIQDQVTSSITSTIFGRVIAQTMQRSRSRPTESWDAYELVLRARTALHGWDRHLAEDLLRQALAIDPSYAHAHGLVVWVQLQKFFNDPPGVDPVIAVELARSALKLDPADDLLHWSAGYAYLWARMFDQAERHFEKALLINPNNVLNIIGKAILLSRTGRPRQSLGELDRALTFDPMPLAWEVDNRTVAHILLGEFEEALAQFEGSQPTMIWHWGYRAIASAHLGKQELATSCVEAMLRMRADCSVDSFMVAEPLLLERDRDRMASGLRLAGLP